MTEKTQNSDGLWDEDVGDDEKTQVAAHPLYRADPGQIDLTRSQSRSLSSFGTPRGLHVGGAEHGSSGRPSLYDRLLQSGALDQGGVAEAKRESARPLEAGLSRSGSLGLPPPPDLRNLAEALEGEDEPDRRDSAEPLRESDLDVISEGPAAEPTRGGDAQATMRPVMPRPIPQTHVPSMLLGPGAGTRNDATERFSHMPSTHPLANSIAPTAPSVRPPAEEKGTPAWLVLIAALVLVGLGAVIGRWRSAPDAAEALRAQPLVTVAATQVAPPPLQAEPLPAEVVNPAAVEPALEPARPAVPAESAASSPKASNTSPADDQAAEATRPERASARLPVTVPASEPEAQRLVPATAASGAADRSSKPSATPPLPAQPAREQVVAAMEATLAALKACAGEQHGTANVTLTVRSSGIVSYALVGGTFAGTPEGSCIARAVKQAQFPPFSDPTIRVTYPFQL